MTFDEMMDLIDELHAFTWPNHLGDSRKAFRAAIQCLFWSRQAAPIREMLT